MTGPSVPVDGHDRSRDGEVVAPMLYPAAALRPDPVSGLTSIVGAPVRGVMTLTTFTTCYSPLWWYYNCSACDEVGQLIPMPTTGDDPRLIPAAQAHRCSDPNARDEVPPG